MTLPPVTFAEALLTNGAYGFPTLKERRVDPVALLCVHVTGNPGNPPATPAQERTYANRAGSNGPSAHYYLSRDVRGGVHAVDWRRFAAWSNGDVNNPKTEVPGVNAVLDLRAKGFNANEAYWIEAESCGRYPDYAITIEQRDSLGWLAAQASFQSGLPIGRSTVHAHSDLNTVTRASCPAPVGLVEALLADVIVRGQAYYNEILVDRLRGQVAVLSSELQAAEDKAASLTVSVTELQDQMKALNADRDVDWAAWSAYADAMKQRVAGALALDEPTRS